jgi:hypothetical protein
MKEEIGHLPGSSSIECQCCGNTLSWSEINKRNSELFKIGVPSYAYDGFDRFHSTPYKEYMCDACVRDGKINAILSPN